MNIKDRLLKLNFEHTSEDIEINDVLLTVITKFQLFEPCRYLSEDDEWLNGLLFHLRTITFHRL